MILLTNIRSLEHDDGTLFDMIRDNVPSGLLTEENLKEMQS